MGAKCRIPSGDYTNVEVPPHSGAYALSTPRLLTTLGICRAVGLLSSAPKQVYEGVCVSKVTQDYSQRKSELGYSLEARVESVVVASLLGLT